MTIPTCLNCGTSRHMKQWPRTEPGHALFKCGECWFVVAVRAAEAHPEAGDGNGDSREFRRNTDPDTSHEAARKVLKRLTVKVRNALESCREIGLSGSTCAGVCRAEKRHGRKGWAPSVSRRMTTLVTRGDVVVVGKRMEENGARQRVVVPKELLGDWGRMEPGERRVDP